MERRSADGRVEVCEDIVVFTIILERQIAYGSVCRAVKIFEKRVIANSVVLVSVGVVIQRKGTESVVEVAACDAIVLSWAAA